MRSRVGFGVWCAALALALWVLHSIGSGDLAAPPVPWRWGQWLDRVEPAAAVASLIRLAALGCAWYLALVTVVGALGRRGGTVGFVAAVDRATPGFLRALLASAGGLTLSAAGLTLAVTPLLAPGDQPQIVAAGAQPAPPLPERAILREARTQSVTSPTATLREVDFRLGSIVTDEARPFAAPQEWVAQTGDHFWAMAAETLHDSWSREPTEAEVTSYWMSLVEVNSSRLRVAANPDLIYPGQVMVLPPVPDE